MTSSDELSCQELIELVTDYIEGTLSPEDRARFEKHVTSCSGCRAYLAQMRRTIEIVGMLEARDIPDDARDQLLRTFRTWKQDALSDEP
jgi:anti-sigma factor RsiW